MEWQDQARNLKFGQRRKVKHCGTDASAYISNSPNGLNMYCFRCGESEFVPHGKLSASEILEMRERDAEETQQVYPEITPMYAHDVPSAAHLWVLQAGLPPERATDKYGFGWSDRTNRVIVPVLHNGKPTGLWTGRAIDGRKPKYLMPKGSIGSSWYGLRRERGPCVVVEDILSAIRIVESGHNAMAVLGTAVGQTQATLIADYPVIGWFDGDKAGRNGYVKLRKSLGPYGIEPKRIETEKDPKKYSLSQIAQYIKDAT